MKNLKRVLSLGLASVMLLGMMVVGASAKDFTDAADIEHTEAVATMVSLKIINGKEDGSYFAPKDTVTRGEMAKMIAVAMQGGSDVNTGVKAVPTFTDTAGHWAEQYIEYCYDLGIINGRGDGTFAPNDNVTGIEVAKMVLTALGYDAEAYKLVGASWATRTDEIARTARGMSIYEKLGNVVMNQPATRDSAAQMIWNGLQANTVTVSPAQNKNNGEVTWEYTTVGTPTLLNQRYKASVITATFVGNADYAPTGAGTPLSDEIVVEYVSAPGATALYYSFPADMPIENIGEEVKVVWKDETKGTSGRPDRFDSIFGVFKTGSTRVENTIVGKVKDHKTSKAQINLNGVVCDVADPVEVVTNYNTSAKYGTGESGTITGGDAVGASSGSNSGLTTFLKSNTTGGNGDTIKAVFNEYGKVKTIYITTTKIAAVSAINNVNVTLNNGIGAVKLDGNEIEDGLKKGDVVTVTTLYAGAPSTTGAYTIVKKAEKVSGEVDGYLIWAPTSSDPPASPTDHTQKITLSGKTYDIYNYKTAKMLNDIPSVDDVKDTLDTGNTQNTYIGKDFDLYLVNGYVGAAVQTSKSANNYSLVTEIKGNGTAGSTFTGLQLQVMAADGTKSIITVSKDSSHNNAHTCSATASSKDAVNTAHYSVGDIVTYTFDKDDLAEVEIVGRATASKLDYNTTTKVLSNSVITTGDCVLFVQKKNLSTKLSVGATQLSGSDYDVYNIRDLDDVKMSTTAVAGTVTAVATNNDGKAVAVFMDLETDPNGAADSTVYGIVSAVNGRVADYYSYTVQSNGDVYEVKSKDTGFSRGDLVKFRPTSDNAYASGKVESVGGAGKDNFAYATWAKEYSSKDNTLTYYGSVTGTDAGGYTTTTPGTPGIYALAKDVKIIYVDKNAKTSAGEASIDKYSEVTGKQNVAFITKMVDSNEVISVLFVETSTKSAIL